MEYRFQFRRYRLPLRSVVRTAHETWTERSGLLVRVSRPDGPEGWGEIAPIPAFGTETVAEAEAVCRDLGEYTTLEQINQVPRRWGCVHAGLAAAMAEAGVVATEGNGATASANSAMGGDAPSSRYRAVAALLPAGRGALEQVAPKADAGFRIFKWKVGVGDAADELALLDDLCGILPTGAKLRLDANGAWDRRRAERWLERCADRPVELVEQPCFAPATEGETAGRRVDDLLLGLANEYPTPIALDESLIGDGDVVRWLGAGWPGWFVIKPSLLGDAVGALAQLEKAKANVVFSSALETGVGARAALRLAFQWRGEAKALGFGVWPLFADARFDGPTSAAFLRAEDVARLDPEAAWNALS